MLPEIIVPNFITRSFISSHRELTFVYADDMTHMAYVGQAAAAKGCENAFSVPTKKRNCRDDNQCFKDNEFDLLTRYYIDRAIDEIPRNKPIICFPLIGCGEAKLPTKAPKTYEYLMKRLKEIEYPNIKRVEKV